MSNLSVKLSVFSLIGSCFTFDFVKFWWYEKFVCSYSFWELLLWITFVYAQLDFTFKSFLSNFSLKTMLFIVLPVENFLQAISVEIWGFLVYWSSSFYYPPVFAFKFVVSVFLFDLYSDMLDMFFIIFGSFLLKFRLFVI